MTAQYILFSSACVEIPQEEGSRGLGSNKSNIPQESLRGGRKLEEPNDLPPHRDNFLLSGSSAVLQTGTDTVFLGIQHGRTRTKDQRG